MILRITKTQCPGHGDIRRLGDGDVISLSRTARERADWPRLVGALMDAVSKGAEVRWAA